MTSKLTREQLHERARENVKVLKMASRQTALESAREDILADLQLTELALAAMDSEPVAWTWHYREQWHVTNDERRAEFVAKDGDVAVLPLYRHAQSAQISEPVLPLQDKDLQGVIDALEHPAGINAAGKQVVRHALVEIQERRKAERDSEPVAWRRFQETPTDGGYWILYDYKPNCSGVEPLYRHAQPVLEIESEPVFTLEVARGDYKGQKLGNHFGFITLDAARELKEGNYQLYTAQPAPVVPDDVLDALQKVARIRLDLNGFDGDRRGIADCLGDAEEALIEVVNRRAAMLNGGKS
ncbi:TPA: hypothetical protein ACXP7I_003286 [Klebsiella variicola subsp. variicola]